MIKIKQQIVSESVRSMRTYKGVNKVRKIAVHQTGNAGKGSNAEAHARLQSNVNPRKASWHITVDDKEAIQSFRDSSVCWAISNYKKEFETLSIEICINSDGDYPKALSNGAKVVAMKLKEHNLKLTDVKRHFDFANKNCPEQLMRGYKGITWNDFLDQVEEYADIKTQVNLKVNGLLDKETIKSMQRYFGTIEDGFISSDSLMIRSLQSFLKKKGYYKMLVDGSFGIGTVKALQGYLGTTVDGVISKPSMMVIELQKRLNRGIL